jgi:hypothetical protein
MNLRIAGVLVGVALVATACGGGGSSPVTASSFDPNVPNGGAPAVTSAPAPSSAPVQTYLRNPNQRTGGSVLTPAGRVITYPSGLTFRFVSAVATVPNEFSGASEYSTVKVTVRVENSGSSVIPIKSSMSIKVYYMPELAPIVEKMTPVPTQVAAGSSVDLNETVTVPTNDIANTSLAVSLGDAQADPFATFTDVGEVTTRIRS